MSQFLLRISLVLAFFMSLFTSAQPVVNEHSIKFENSTTATLVGENGVIMRTTNNGFSWVQQESNLTNPLYGNSCRNGISLAVGEHGIILRSTDQGNNWVVILPEQ